MRKTYSALTRMTALLLVLVCVLGLLPATALAANPSTIKMDDCAYSGTKYDSPALGECYMHQMHFNYNGKSTMGFCAEKGKGMGWSLKGHTWGNPQPISDPTVKTMMAYFYAHSTGVFTDQAKALGVDDVWNSDYTWTMNGGSGQPRPPRQRADRPGAGPGGVTDNCLPIHLDIVKKVRYDVGYQTTGGVAK